MNQKLQEIETFIEVNTEWKKEKKNFHIVLVELYSLNSFGIHTIGRVVKSHGFKVSYISFKKLVTDNINLPTEGEYKKIVELIQELKPDIIGIGTNSPFAPVAMELIHKMKKLNCPVILGGAHAIYHPDSCIKHVDFVCVGEGEAAILKLLYALYNGEDYKTTNNLWIRENGTIIKNDLNPLIQNLDLIPFPDFTDENKFYIENDTIRSGELYYTKAISHYIFMSGRGCPFACSYCCNSYLIKHYKNKGAFIRRRSVKNVIDEINNARSNFPHLTKISSNDEVFTLDKKWLVDFCEKYKKEIDIPFHCDIYPSKVSDEIIAILKGIKLNTITMGIQTGSEKIRQEVYKRHTPDEMLIKCANIFNTYNIYPFYDFIIDNPLESIKDIEASLQLLLKFPRPFRTNIYNLQYISKTELTSDYLSKGIIKETDLVGSSLEQLKRWHMKLDVNLYYKNKDLFFIFSLINIMSYSFSLATPYMNYRAPIFPTWLINILMKNNKIIKNRLLFILKAMCNIGVSAEKLSYRLSLLLSGNFRRIIERLFYYN